MDRALFAGATGMAAQQRNLETIAANLANADSPGFKGSSETFAQLLAPGGSVLGTVALGTRVLLGQGKLERSGGAFDVAIDGGGFFRVDDARGRAAYTRCGAFSRAADGSLRDAQGRTLHGIRVPEAAASVTVSEDGTVRATIPGGTVAAGRIGVYEFAAPDRLRAIGGTSFEATPDSGPASPTRAAGVAGGPSIRFGMLERSNVSIVEAMMQLLTAQRAYEANAKSVQAADEMLRIANNLQRG